MAESKRVMGFGTFDALHPGHLFYLRELRKLGDELFVVVARDSNVTRIKGRAPHFDEKERLRAVAATGLANQTVLGHETDFMKVVRAFKPHAMGFGYDQQVDLKTLKQQFPAIDMVRIKPYKPHQYKSSIIKAVPPVQP